jgi:ORF6N domain-containing protein
MRAKSLTISPSIRISTIRQQKVVLDSDLAETYGVSTGRFNEAVKRNLPRFPEDFSFVLTREEFNQLTSQNAISKHGREENSALRSQIATLKKGAGIANILPASLPSMAR